MCSSLEKNRGQSTLPRRSELWRGLCPPPSGTVRKELEIWWESREEEGGEAAVSCSRALERTAANLTSAAHSLRQPGAH